MGNLFTPVKDLVGSIYDVLFDAATKVWSLVKPVVLIGLTVDLVTGKLGWITTILEYYRRTLEYTAGTSWLVLIIGGLLVMSWFAKKA